MPNVTASSLREAGVPKELWARAKVICNSPPYRVKRVPYKALGGPFNGEIVYLEDGETGPIRVGNQVGQYKYKARTHKDYTIGTIEWKPL